MNEAQVPPSEDEVVIHDGALKSEFVKQLHDENWDALVRFLGCIGFARADGEDVVQELFARMCERPEPFLAAQDRSAYLRRSVLNQARANAQRNRKLSCEQFDPQNPAHIAAAGKVTESVFREESMRRELERDVNKVMETLTDGDRALLSVLRDGDYGERAAERLGKSIGAYNKFRSRTLARLGSQLRRLGWSESDFG
ncbi:hypothetical protein GC163_24560 [bacterium]|nr:hypothetical protein [bacterium]